MSIFSKTKQSGLLSDEDYKAYGIVPPEKPGFGDVLEAIPPYMWFAMAAQFQEGNAQNPTGINKGLGTLTDLLTEVKPQLDQRATQEAIYKSMFGPQQTKAGVAPPTPPAPQVTPDPASGMVPRPTSSPMMDPTLGSAPPLAGPSSSPPPGEPSVDPTHSAAEAPPGLLSGMGLSADEQKFYALWMMVDPKAAFTAISQRGGGGNNGQGRYYSPIPVVVGGQRKYVQPRRDGGYDVMEGIAPPPTPGVQQSQMRSLKDMSTGAAAGARMMSPLSQMEALLKQNPPGGLGYPEVSLLGRGALYADDMAEGALGVRPLESLGVIDEETRKQATIAEQLDSLSKTVGIELLTSIGGNDTERELITAIQTAYNPRARVESNLVLIKIKKAAAKVAMDLPGEYTQWIQRYQDEFHGPVIPDGKGGQVMLTWPMYWKMRQQEIMRSYGVPSLKPEEWDAWYSQYASDEGGSSPQGSPANQQAPGVPAWAR